MNSEIKNAYNKQYYNKNKETIINHLKQKQLCELCNREFTLSSISKHNKSKIHLALLKNITIYKWNILIQTKKTSNV